MTPRICCFDKIYYQLAVIANMSVECLYVNTHIQPSTSVLKLLRKHHLLSQKAISVPACMFYMSIVFEVGLTSFMLSLNFIEVLCGLKMTLLLAFHIRPDLLTTMRLHVFIENASFCNL